MNSYQVECAGHKHQFQSTSRSGAAELFVAKVHRDNSGQVQLGELIFVRELPIGLQAFILTKMILEKMKIDSEKCSMVLK